VSNGRGEDKRTGKWLNANLHESVADVGVPFEIEGQSEGGSGGGAHTTAH
jgi:hypothetical protein